MDLAEGKFRELEGKIRQLAENHQQLKAEKDQLIRQSVILKKTIEEKETEAEQLKKQVRSLEEAESPITSKGTAVTKEKIQDLVREIDRCIELLKK